MSVYPFDNNSVYITFKIDNVDVAFSKVDEHNSTDNALIYFHSNDLDADIAKVKDLGGKVVLPRQDIEGYGALGIFLDPMGNRVAFWQSDHPS